MLLRNPTCLDRCAGCEVELSTCGGCCCCIPPDLCVTLRCDEYNDATVLVPYDSEDEAYQGIVGGMDFRLTIERDDERKCWIFLESYCAGLVGDYRLKQPLEQCDSFSAEFGLEDIYGCDSNCSSAVLSIAQPDRVNGEDADVCDDCECFCRCVCISYTTDGPTSAVVDVKTACGGGAWSVEGLLPRDEVGDPVGDPINVSLSIECDQYDETTYLTVSVEGATVVDPPDCGDATPCLGNRAFASCPHLFAEWHVVQEGYEQYEERAGTITVGCATCGDCEVFVEDDCCGSPNFEPPRTEPMPDTLFASFRWCCLEVVKGETIELSYSPGSGSWSGNIADWCLGYPATLKLRCTGGTATPLYELNLIVEGPFGPYPLSCDAQNTFDENLASSCQPFEVSFTGIASNCCSAEKTFEWEVTITE